MRFKKYDNLKLISDLGLGLDGLYKYNIKTNVLSTYEDNMLEYSKKIEIFRKLK
jgi:hypothetical protein